MIAVMRLFATCAILFALACSTPAQQRPPASAATPAGGDVAARVGTRTITMGEVDERWQKSQPASRALQSPQQDQDPEGGGERGEQRHHGERDDPEPEHAGGPEAVGERAARQQQRRERHGVGVDRPLLPRHRTAQRAGDVRQCHVEDRAVEQNHQIAE